MAKRITWILSAVLAVYVAFTISRGFDFLHQTQIPVKLLGASVIVIGALGIYVIARELQFGFRVARMTERVDFSGKPERGSVLTTQDKQRLFDEAVRAIESQDSDWQSWYHMAVAYDVSGDRPRAREAMRHALSLFSNH